MALPPIPATLPYFRDPAEMPGPLPTLEEIRDAPRCGLSPRSSSGLLHLVMEYIPGADLESVWTSLSVEAKSSIVAQLRPMLAQIRSLTPPDECIGGVCGDEVPDPLFGTPSPDAKVNGPFRAEEEVGLAFARASRSNSEQNGRHGWMADFFARHLPVALEGYGTKFIHGDLYMRNILVEKVPMATASSSATGVEAEDDGQAGSYRVSAIVDWELAGWYPAYWEYAAALARYEWDDDWLETVDAILKPYPLEASMFLLVLRDLQFL